MPSRLLLPFAVVAAMTMSSCGGEPTDPIDDAECATMLNDPDNADALDWLKAPSPVPRRAGRLSVDEALALVHKYDSRGAVRLIAFNNVKLGPPAVKKPYLYSHGLLIQLPDDPARRYAVFTLYAEQVRDNGFAPRADTGQKYLFVHWPGHLSPTD